MEAGEIPQIPMLLFGSNGLGTGWNEEAWRKYQIEYAQMVENETVIEMDCPHYLYDYQYEMIRIK